VDVVRWLLDKGGRPLMVRLLVQRGADPTIVSKAGSTSLTFASSRGHLEIMRLLLGHPSAETTINHRDRHGQTALWWACYNGRGWVGEGAAREWGRPHDRHQQRHHPHGHRQASPFCTLLLSSMAAGSASRRWR
jgi:hypothetical protein